MSRLTTTQHDRNAAGLSYVYPVMSRRAGGLSIGINFNPNNACNWRCVYCQVPNLQRGTAPAMNFALLEDELRGFLAQVTSGEFFDRFQIAQAQRVIKDIAISGNGEPTSLRTFDRAIRLIGDIAREQRIFPNARFVVISNGSLIHLPHVQRGLRELACFDGELWFKLDSATEQGRRLINDSQQGQPALLKNLKLASDLCTVKLQTCVFHYQQSWSAQEKQAYLALLDTLKTQNINVRQILLYSIARASCQPEAAALENMTRENIDILAADITALGYDVSVNA